MILKTTTLTPESLKIIRDKATEKPFSGAYHLTFDPGTYLCKQCGLALFRANTKFNSACGWPSFDTEIANAVTLQPDADGQRCEIICSRCQAHLGHVFSGEGYTAKNLRYCVNAASLDFVTDLTVTDTEEAILAAGCFWGVEYYLNKLRGVLKTEVGYTGGSKNYPTYNEICAGNTAHLEAVRVIYDPLKISYREIVKYFFEIHDFTQIDGQGPDRATQYLSAIFYLDISQREIAQELIAELGKKSYSVATKILPAKIFWQAEADHQAYYQKNGKIPYCHTYTKRWD